MEGILEPLTLGLHGNYYFGYCKVLIPILHSSALNTYPHPFNLSILKSQHLSSSKSFRLDQFANI